MFMHYTHAKYDIHVNGTLSTRLQLVCHTFAVLINNLYVLTRDYGTIECLCNHIKPSSGFLFAFIFQTRQLATSSFELSANKHASE